MKYNILGAGPAGLSSAIVISSKGYEVNLYEQTTVIGGFIGSDIQVIRNYGKFDEHILSRFKSKGIKISNYNKIFRIEKYSPDLKFDTIYSKKEPLFYTVKRGVDNNSLENQLADQAVDNGVNLLLGYKNTHTNAQVIATGSKFFPEGTIYGSVFDVSDYDPRLIKFFLRQHNGHSSYVYVAPYNDNTLTVALTSFDKKNFKNLKSEFDLIIKKHPIISEIVKNGKLLHMYGGYGHFNIPKSAIHNYKLVIGGAAGFVDPARGFGIKYAILSGALSGISLTTNKNYDDLWKEEFEEELIEGFSRKLIFEKLSKLTANKLITGRTIPVKEYDKTPNSIKKMLHSINKKLHINAHRSKFTFEDIYPV